MIITLHIVIAVFSIGFTSYAYLRPSASKLRVAYGLAAGTLTSGVYLAWSAPVHMAHVCIAGLVYLGFVLAALVAVKAKLAGIKSQLHTNAEAS